mmetsp:Transcript_10259/g.42571  ORF Transcript_10259/g.42571 Transcript_10259/m.42571 type:complete len:219 (-) Transcript_10259:60-716(-)
MELYFSQRRLTRRTSAKASPRCGTKASAPPLRPVATAAAARKAGNFRGTRAPAAYVQVWSLAISHAPWMCSKRPSALARPARASKVSCDVRAFVYTPTSYVSGLRSSTAIRTVASPSLYGWGTAVTSTERITRCDSSAPTQASSARETSSKVRASSAPSNADSIVEAGVRVLPSTSNAVTRHGTSSTRSTSDWNSRRLTTSSPGPTPGRGTSAAGGAS